MTSKDGGPAFPVSSYVNGDGETFESKPQGMTLRDYFAAKALQGLLASHANQDATDPYTFGSDCMARRAYQIADAMLAEREKP